ncbi:hypothetical protein L1887_24126 [Cichorium endivia]|nr:hypothetical protein L1887_24126 [Cichorium endivia]
MSERPLSSSDPDGEPVDQTFYRSMIGSLIYLTTSRPDIVLAVRQCAGHQANTKKSHLMAVKRIFRYLKGRPTLGLLYPKNREFDLYAFSDSNYRGCDIDKKSASAGCQFSGDRLISWQCKKQQTVSRSTVEAEYVAASACCSQDLQSKVRIEKRQLKLLEFLLNQFASTSTPVCDLDDLKSQTPVKVKVKLKVGYVDSRPTRKTGLPSELSKSNLKTI